MTRLTGILLAASGLLGCAHRGLQPGLVADDIVTVRTEDGWVLPLRHYPGAGEPVVLMHGMGANHNNWDFRAEVSPVDELLSEGFDVWVPSLRGDPETTPPDRRSRTRVAFDDHAIRDVPAILDHIHAATGHDQLLWVGHSMGGMLLYTTLVTRPESIRAGVAISSPATFREPLNNHALVRRMGFFVAARRGRIPVRPFAPALVGVRPMLRQLGNPDQLDRATMRGLARHALIDLPRPTVRQVRQWTQHRELVTRDGTPWLAAAPTVSVPLLVMAGPDDHVVSEPDVAFACQIFPVCDYVQLSAEEGFGADYGHIDTVLGTTAHAEVYPLVFEFLREHRADGAVTSEP